MAPETGGRHTVLFAGFSLFLTAFLFETNFVAVNLDELFGAAILLAGVYLARRR